MRVHLPASRAEEAQRAVEAFSDGEIAIIITIMRLYRDCESHFSSRVVAIGFTRYARDVRRC